MIDAELRVSYVISLPNPFIRFASVIKCCVKSKKKVFFEQTRASFINSKWISVEGNTEKRDANLTVEDNKRLKQNDT